VKVREYSKPARRQMDYSKTVNLPRTDFPMKANLPNREPEILKKWTEEKIYEKIQESRKDAELFILHDGPPYANGHIHIGHALNKILKDIIIKHKSTMGFRSPYVPGWDCHGLPIELEVMKKLGKKNCSMEKVEIRKLCREYAEKFVHIQMDEFKRLGVFGDYENPYLTMSKDYEATIVRVFGEIFEKGFIQRNKKPIYWCPSCVTALAEAEVEYDDHKSPSVYVKFKVDPKSLDTGGVDTDKLYAVIWTTTPWTLPANLALSFHPEFPYSIYTFGDEHYILADGLIEKFESEIEKKHDAKSEITHEAIKTLKTTHPFIERESRIIFGEHVTLEQGTGIVHTAPGHGYEDYIAGLEHGLDVFCPVDDYGRYDNGFPEMKGVKVFEANEKIVELMKSNGTLIHSDEVEHSYPHCWRCKKPLIYRATEQWFMVIDHDNLREKAMESVDNTEWVPSWGESRFRSMAESRPDWCLSRQRSWGVPIPSFKCEECGKNMMSAESVLEFSRIAGEKGIDAWYTDEINELVPEGTKCECGSTQMVKEFDILDVWFDSGVSNLVVLDNWKDHRWPSDIYLEGSDQHRGWFQSSLWPVLALRGRAPYNTVLTHGFVLDEKGKAMSKSVGNVIPPEKLIKQFGADILRLWVSSEDYRNDLRIGMDMVQQIADSYRRIRNTFKFIIGNISDFTENDLVEYEDLSSIDKWILNKLSRLSEAVIRHYEDFEFHLVYRKILNFCAVELSSIYFDISKDILYIEEKDSKIRRCNQTVLYEIYNSLVRLISPILSFTAEEIWQFMGNSDSIHMQNYYSLNEKFNNPEIEKNIEMVVDVKKDALKALEELRKDKVIKASLEADIEVYVGDEAVKAQMRGLGDELRRLFQVAKITLTESETDGMTVYEKSSIKAVRSAGEKCVRCWNYTDQLGTDEKHSELCPRCTQIINNMDL
jgi:isoleucyl-tRNA synthetase